MVAKPMVVVLLAMLCLLAGACSPVSSQEANRQGAPAADSPPDGTAQATVARDAENEETATESTKLTDESDAGSDADASSISTGDRGSRTLGSEEEPTQDATESPTETPDGAASPEPVEDAEPAATNIATTEPVAATDPAATATPTATAEPTPTSAPIFTAPEPTGPVPSDDIVVQGPDIDESQPVTISDLGASACAAAESAIEFLDLGDTNRTAAALQKASQFAEQATEREIAAMAPELAAAGANEDAAIAAIIATLNACAIHGYQV